MQKIPPTWTLQLGAAVVYFFADILCKKFAAAPSWTYAIYLQLMYIVVSTFWLLILIKENSLIVQGMIWSAITLMLSVYVGKFMFHEVIHPHQVVGLCFGAICLILLSF